ncbi:hypothetical protein [Candidatus Protochlamydia phocaeensis]|uniref:hypothetical protein n=1 Tax=Candidatus Protochlamydia phocaeensis TaxID=1414722 RepID=UPI000837A9D8|nr:hypothetical protein [Candidatus Protochlamydia phocaeensis]
MSANTNTSPVAGPEDPTAGAAPAADATQAGQTPTTGDGTALSPNSSYSNLDAFKKAAPAVYKQMMQGIAMNICNDMKHHQERLKEMWRKASQDAEGK